MIVVDVFTADACPEDILFGNVNDFRCKALEIELDSHSGGVHQGQDDTRARGLTA